MRSRLTTSVLAVEDARLEWQAAAEQVGFPGQPTADLPPRPHGLHRAMRFEPSLLVGINATEGDAARREAFERAVS